MKIVKSILITSALTIGTSYSLPFVNIEFGGLAGIDIRNDESISSKNIKNNVESVKSNFTNKNINNIRLAYGAYARAWLGGLIKFGPVIKFEQNTGLGSVKKEDVVKNLLSDSDAISNKSTTPSKIGISYNTYTNLQYGALIGFDIPLIGLLPYAGASFSQFTSNSAFEHTFAVNYGIKFGIPFIPLLTLGIDGSFQNPKIKNTDSRLIINRIAMTIGIEI